MNLVATDKVTLHSSVPSVVIHWKLSKVAPLVDVLTWVLWLPVHNFPDSQKVYMKFIKRCSPTHGSRGIFTTALLLEIEHWLTRYFQMVTTIAQVSIIFTLASWR